MRTLLIWLTLLALTIAPVRGQEDDEDAPAADSKSPASEAQKKYSALVKEFDTARETYFKDYQKATTDAERAKLSYPQQEKYAAKFLELARANSKDRAAVDALVWVAQSCRQGKELDESLDLLLSDYISSGRLQSVASALVYAQTDRSENWLRTVAEKSPHAKVRGKATYSLGQLYFQMAENAASLNDEQNAENLKRWLGEKAFARLKTDTAEGWQKKSEQLFEQVIEKYGDVKSHRGTLGDAAKGQLFEIRELAIGKVAPEIEGEDVDGKAFKLSDYRGKVVVIDFWGDW